MCVVTVCLNVCLSSYMILPHCLGWASKQATSYRRDCLPCWSGTREIQTLIVQFHLQHRSRPYRWPPSYHPPASLLSGSVYLKNTHTNHSIVDYTNIILGLPWWLCGLRYCEWLLAVSNHWLGSNRTRGMWGSCQWLGVRGWFLPGTLVSSTSYNWLVTTYAIWQKKWWKMNFQISNKCYLMIIKVR